MILHAVVRSGSNREKGATYCASVGCAHVTTALLGALVASESGLADVALVG